MASAPGGSGAPVMMRNASPASSGREATRPAAITSRTASSVGDPAAAGARSKERTAKPSIDELSNGGSAWRATTSERSARRAAWWSGTHSGSEPKVAASTRARASA